MAPKASVTPRTNQTKKLLRSAHISVGTTMQRLIRIPPIVGVPALLWWDCGPSSRMYCPIWNFFSLSMTQGPSTSERTSAVMLA